MTLIIAEQRAPPSLGSPLPGPPSRAESHRFSLAAREMAGSLCCVHLGDFGGDYILFLVLCLNASSVVGKGVCVRVKGQEWEEKQKESNFPRKTHAAG